jgi:hypothetical protein
MITDDGLIGGLGGTEAAVKWRFLDQQTNGDGFDMSMFPRVICNVVSSSPRRGLSQEGTRFQIPMQMSKAFGRWHANVEFGPHVSSVGRSEWLYGVVAGLDASKRTLLMAELQGTSRMDFSRDTLTVNVGVHHEFSETRILIVSLGRGFVRPILSRRSVSAECSCSTEPRVLRVSSMRVRSRLLRENQNQRDDYHQER